MLPKSGGLVEPRREDAIENDGLEVDLLDPDRLEVGLVVEPDLFRCVAHQRLHREYHKEPVDEKKEPPKKIVDSTHWPWLSDEVLMSSLHSYRHRLPLWIGLACALSGPALAQSQSVDTPRATMRVSKENPPPQLDQTSYRKLFELCKPCADKEAWTEIAWIGEFWQGRQQAARVGKPMFIFAMNGHPLGCV
jgi:hypothetical protein